MKHTHPISCDSVTTTDTSATNTVAGALAVTGAATITGAFTADTGAVSLAGSNQVSKISDPTGGATTDAEARTAINAIIDALEAYGIAASS